MQIKTIDLNWLEEQDACSGGVEWFKGNFPTHSAPTDTVVQELIKQGREGHFGWLMWVLSGKNRDYCYTLNRVALDNKHEGALMYGRNAYYVNSLHISSNFVGIKPIMRKMWQRVQDIETPNMYVTYAALEEKRACSDGLEAFESRYGRDTTVHLEDLIEDTINTTEESSRVEYLSFTRLFLIPHMLKDAEMTDRMYVHCLNNMPEEEFKNTPVYQDYEEDKQYRHFYVANLTSVPKEYLLGCYNLLLERTREKEGK